MKRAVLSPSRGDVAAVTSCSSWMIWFVARTDLHNLFATVDRVEPHPYVFEAIGLDRQAHHVGLDRQLAVTSINQHGQPDACRPSQVADRVERGADRPSGEEDVVHQHHFRAVHVEGNLGAFEHGPALTLPEVVAVERDVHRPDLDFRVEQNSHFARQPLRERHPPAPNPNQVQRRPASTGVGELTSHRRDQSA